MRDGVMPDRWVTSPNSVTSRRPKSMREIYRPAVQDLSEIAAKYGSNYLEETILSVVTNGGSASVGRPATSDTYQSSGYSKAPDTADQLKNSTVPSVSQRSSDYQEDLHRQRVFVSAHHRNKLHRIRRTKSQPIGAPSTGCDKSLGNGQRIHANEDDVATEKIDLMVTNSNKQSDQQHTENAKRVNYRWSNRAIKPQSTIGNLKAAGSPLPVMNGYHQQLLNNHPKFSQGYCQWLTNGLKVQRFHSNIARAAPLAPPRTFTMTRPRTVNGRWGTQKGTLLTDFNIVGQQKVVQSAENLTHLTQRDIERYIKNE